MPTLTTYRTWVDGELETAAIFNQQIRDNGGYLLNRPGQIIKRINAASYSTTSTTFVDIDATNLIITVTNAGSVVIVSFTCQMDNSVNVNTLFDFVLNGVRYASANTQGLGQFNSVANNPGGFISYCVPVAVTPGSNVFKVQWASVSGVATKILSTAATNPVIFAVAEIG